MKPCAKCHPAYYRGKHVQYEFCRKHMAMMVIPFMVFVVGFLVTLMWAASQ